MSFAAVLLSLVLVLVLVLVPDDPCRMLELALDLTLSGYLVE